MTMPVEDGLGAEQLLALYAAAEEAGYHTALCGEVAGAEVLSLMGMAAARTSRIRLGSGILATYTRPAPLAAMGFATLASAAPGRIVAGFGASSPIIVGRWHGLEFNKPYTTTREYLELFSRAMAGGKVNYDGDELRCDGFRLQMTPPAPVPVWLGAMGDRMLALAGAVADGAFLAWCPPGEVAGKRQRIREAGRAAGRDPDSVELVCSFWGYAGDRPDEARERMRRSVLAYAMVPTHQHCFAGCFPRLAEAAEAWGAGDRRRALGCVDDAVVDAVCAVGEDAVRCRIAEYRQAGVDTPILLPTGAAPGDADGSMQTVLRCAP
ncbi:MAG: LLM class flavin-dependent oxidoreductase [bacterium]|nr:LLM class flavin-dependent oxidoreductase [bacterium]